MKSLILLFLLLGGICIKGFAQSFRHISDKHGVGIDDIITSISQDKYGFMWFGTTSGLYRYDAHTFKQYRHDPSDTSAIPSNYINAVFCDTDGFIWIGTWKGLSRYDYKTESFRTFKHNPRSTNSISSDSIYCITQDKYKNLWIGTDKGLNKVNSKDNAATFTPFCSNINGGAPLAVQNMIVGEKSELWLATEKGLVLFDHNKAELYKPNPDPRFPSVGDFKSIFKDKSGNIWLGIKSGGLMRFQIESRRFQLIDNFKSPKGNWPYVSGIVTEQADKFWLATLEGLAHFDSKTFKAQWHVNSPGNDQSLGDDNIMCVFQDRANGIWLGTYYSGIDYFNTTSPKFTNWPFFVDRSTNSTFLSSWMGMTPDQKLWLISSDKKQLILYDDATQNTTKHDLELNFSDAHNHFFIDENGVIWYGSKRLLYSYNYKTGAKKNYPFPSEKDTPAGRNRIIDISQDTSQRLWLSTPFGLYWFDKGTGNIHSTAIKTIVVSSFEDSKGNIWVAGAKEVWRIATGSLHIDKISLENVELHHKAGYEQVWRITEDHKGRIWIATNEGLKLYDRKRNQFVVFPDKKENLRLSSHDLASDEKGYLWLSTRNTLVRYHPDKGTKQTYSYHDGIPKKSSLNINNVVKDRAGRLYFNTNQEMISVEPNQISTDNTPEAIVLSSLRLFDRVVKANDDTGILQQDVSQEKELTFKHDQNIFTLDFALLSYARSHENKYQYRMEGFEENWNEVSVPSATYMNLAPGNYTFTVKAVDGDGTKLQEPLKLKIAILPPWWNTWYANMLYIVLITTLLFLITRFFWLRSLFRKENALNQIKLDFFTNISHEIRTHLSLISGPLEKAFQQVSEGKSAENNLNYARRNSERLMLLVNELLDFRKIQNGKVRLQVRQHDVVKILKNVISSFEHTANEKNIQTTFTYPDTSVLLWFDLSQMQKVFYNVLSNAYKFTPEGGKINVHISENMTETSIRVEDNGKGISEDHLKKLFTYYYQVDSEKPGYGIGLALSKSIVEQHMGHLTAESNLSTDVVLGGTTLAIRMLRGYQHFPADMIVTQNNDYTENTTITETVALPVNPSRVLAADTNTMLIIEDNHELRAFISELFSKTFKIIEAENGLQGLKFASEFVPDIILSDVMMPEMNGLEVCRQLKNNIETAHIPVILLTARTQNKHIIEGLTAGADDYLSKPFDPTILELKINNLIRSRDERRERHRMLLMADDQAGTNIARNVNEEFISRLRNLTIEALSDPDFGVTDLAFRSGISVSALYRKVRSLTGITVNDFIKTVRLAEGKKLLESGVYNVNEVANMVGFEDSRHFSKEFKKGFGKTPNEIKRPT